MKHTDFLEFLSSLAPRSGYLCSVAGLLSLSLSLSVHTWKNGWRRACCVMRGKVRQTRTRTDTDTCAQSVGAYAHTNAHARYTQTKKYGTQSVGALSAQTVGAHTHTAFRGRAVCAVCGSTHTQKEHTHTNKHKRHAHTHKHIHTERSLRERCRSARSATTTTSASSRRMAQILKSSPYTGTLKSSPYIGILGCMYSGSDVHGSMYITHIHAGVRCTLYYTCTYIWTKSPWSMNKFFLL